jgi:hypothetical protein
MPDMKTITVSNRSRHRILHIEIPGGIVNIRHNLRDDQGREVTHVSVSVDGNRYAGDPEWWVDGERGNNGPGGVRIVCTGPKPKEP